MPEPMVVRCHPLRLERLELCFEGHDNVQIQTDPSLKPEIVVVAGVCIKTRTH